MDRHTKLAILEGIADIIRSHVEKPRIDIIDRVAGDLPEEGPYLGGGHFTLFIDNGKLISSGNNGWNMILDKEYDLSDSDFIWLLMVQLDRGFKFLPYSKQGTI